jgi:hypothetical protein
MAKQANKHDERNDFAANAISSYSQFRQHFMRSFFANFFLPKKYKPKL